MFYFNDIIINMAKYPKILIVGSTHGHERIGLKIIEELKNLNVGGNILEFVIGNPIAFSKSVPFIDSDLNRSFPGNEFGTYEEKRAFELIPKITSADIVIDIHSTNTTDLSNDSMLIITALNPETQNIIDIIKPPKVLYMKYRNSAALISNAKVGIAFEYGKDDSDFVLQATLHDIANILIHTNVIKSNPYKTKKHVQKTEMYEVYDAFNKNFSGTYTLNSSIRNFELCSSGSTVCTTESGEDIVASESFIPILFGENRYTSILGFKAKKI